MQLGSLDDQSEDVLVWLHQFLDTAGTVSRDQWMYCSPVCKIIFVTVIISLAICLHDCKMHSLLYIYIPGADLILYVLRKIMDAFSGSAAAFN